MNISFPFHVSKGDTRNIDYRRRGAVGRHANRKNSPELPHLDTCTVKMDVVGTNSEGGLMSEVCTTVTGKWDNLRFPARAGETNLDKIWVQDRDSNPNLKVELRQQDGAGTLVIKNSAAEHEMEAIVEVPVGLVGEGASEKFKAPDFYEKVEIINQGRTVIKMHPTSSQEPELWHINDGKLVSSEEMRPTLDLLPDWVHDRREFFLCTGNLGRGSVSRDVTGDLEKLSEYKDTLALGALDESEQDRASNLPGYLALDSGEDYAFANTANGEWIFSGEDDGWGTQKMEMVEREGDVYRSYSMEQGIRETKIRITELDRSGNGRTVQRTQKSDRSRRESGGAKESEQELNNLPSDSSHNRRSLP